jgi:hypothetical protein
MGKRVLKNTFSWSVSRDNVFLECPREYYYRYYGHWGGWEVDAPRPTRDIYVLKQLKHRPTWIGEVVHDCIKRSLKNLARGIPVLAVDEILALTRDRMRTDFRNSRSGHYHTNPKYACGLFEHEYGVPVSDEEWRAAAEQVDLCLRNFYDSDVYTTLRELPPDDFLEIEELSKIPLDGIDINIKLDCAVRESDRIIVWDWKSGRREGPGSQLQMACYAYYASARYGIPIRNVFTRRYELFHNAVHEDSLGTKALEELLGYIRGSIKDMKALLDDPEGNLAVEDRFSKVEDRRICRRCNFLRVCRPALPDKDLPPGARSGGPPKGSRSG